MPLSLCVAKLLAATNWTAIIVAALGSSALGAIVGGYLTTRMQGRHEREEAWRTRLIDAADSLDQTLTEALTTLGRLLPRVARGEERLRAEDGALTQEAAKNLDTVRALMTQAELQLSHMELLVTGDAKVYQLAFRTMRLIDFASALARCSSSPRLTIQALIAERDDTGAGFQLLVDADDASRFGFVQTLMEWEAFPPVFEPSSDLIVAQWARQAHQFAASSVHDYMQAARQYIEQYSLNQGRPTVTERARQMLAR
jgi:hypothetical protein